MKQLFVKMCAVVAAVCGLTAFGDTAQYTAPQFGGTVWTWNTETSMFDADGQESTATPSRLNSKGPEYYFGKDVGTVVTAVNTSTDTSDAGGIKIEGTDSGTGPDVTSNIGRWAGAIDVGPNAILTADYSAQLKSTEGDGVANVYVEGTLNLKRSSSGTDLNLNDGGNQRWFIGENGMINLVDLKTVTKGSRTWGLQAVLSKADLETLDTVQDDPVIEDIVNRTRVETVVVPDDGARVLITSASGTTIKNNIDTIVLFDYDNEELSDTFQVVVDGNNLVVGKKVLRYQPTSLTTGSDVTWTNEGTADDTLFNGTSFMNGDTVTFSAGTATLATDVEVNEMKTTGAVTFTGNGNTITVADDFDVGGNTALGADTTTEHTYLRNAATLTIGKDTTLSTTQLRMGEGSKGYVTVDGGTLTITGTKNDAESNASSLILAHWAASKGSQLTLKDGTINAGGTVMFTSIDGDGTYEQIDGTATLKGINYADKWSNSGNNEGKVVLTGGTLNIGATGLVNFGTAGGLELAGGTLKSTTAFPITAISGGSILVSGDMTIDTTDGDITISAPMTGSGVITKKGSGVLAVGEARPTMDVQEGSIKITATTAEVAAGKLVLPIPESATAASLDKVAIVDASGAELEIIGEPVIDEAAHTLTLNLQTLPKITEATSISELGLADDAAGVVVIEGADYAYEAFDVTFDKALPAGVTISVTGCVNLKVGGDVTELPLSVMTLESGTTIAIDTSCTLTVPSGVTVNASGDIAVTLTNNGTFNVVSGTCTVTAANGQSIKGTVNIAKGAKFVNVTPDAIAYSGSTIVNVKGTLDMGTTRWTVGGSSQINLYGGCTVDGEGDGGAIFDLFRTGKILNVIAVEGESDTVTMGLIRARKGDSEEQSDITIDEDMTLVLAKGISKYDTDGYIAKFGAGTLLIKGTVATGCPAVRAGTLELADATVNTTISCDDGSALAISGNTTLNGAVTGSVGCTVDENAVLTLNAAFAPTLQGKGEVDLASLQTTSIGDDWEGSVKLPAITEKQLIDFNAYGRTGSKVIITSITTGYPTYNTYNTINPELVLEGDMILDDCSSRYYTFTKISGDGAFTWGGTQSYDPKSIAVTEYSAGKVTNKTGTTLTIDTLALPAGTDVTAGALLLEKEGAVTVAKVTVDGVEQDIDLAVKENGVYVANPFDVSFDTVEGVTFKNADGVVINGEDYAIENGESMVFTADYDTEKYSDCTVSATAGTLTYADGQYTITVNGAAVEITATLTAKPTGPTVVDPTTGKTITITESGNTLTATVDPNTKAEDIKTIMVNGYNVRSGLKVTVDPTTGVMTAVIDEETPATDALEKILTGEGGTIEVVAGLCYGTKSGTTLNNVKGEPATTLNKDGTLEIEAGNFVKIRITTVEAAEE